MRYLLTAFLLWFFYCLPAGGQDFIAELDALDSNFELVVSGDSDFQQMKQQLLARERELLRIEQSLFDKLSELHGSQVSRDLVEGRYSTESFETIGQHSKLYDAVYRFRKMVWIHLIERNIVDLRLEGSGAVTDAEFKSLINKYQTFRKSFDRIGRQFLSAGAVTDFIAEVKDIYERIRGENEGTEYKKPMLRKSFEFLRSMIHLIINLPHVVNIGYRAVSEIYQTYTRAWLERHGWNHWLKSKGLVFAHEGRNVPFTRDLHSFSRSLITLSGKEFRVIGAENAVRSGQLPPKTIQINMAPHTGGMLDIGAMAHVPGADRGVYVARTKNALKTLINSETVPEYYRKLLANHPDLISVGDGAAQIDRPGESTAIPKEARDLMRKVESGVRIFNIFPAGYIAERTGSGATNILPPQLVEYWIKPLLAQGYRIQITPVTTPNALFYDRQSILTEGNVRYVMVGKTIPPEMVETMIKRPNGARELMTLVQTDWIHQLVDVKGEAFHNGKMMAGMMRILNIKQRLQEILDSDLDLKHGLGACSGGG